MASTSSAVQKILADSRLLVTRLREHDDAADKVIVQAQALKQRVDAIKQYQESIGRLNEIAHHRPRMAMILGLLRENQQIRELEQENRELQACLAEHQSALELIMSKYREQVFKLMMVNKLDRSAGQRNEQKTLVEEKLEKMSEMVAVMKKAAELDDDRDGGDDCGQSIERLRSQNETLRGLLEISSNTFLRGGDDDRDADEFEDRERRCSIISNPRVAKTTLVSSNVNGTDIQIQGDGMEKLTMDRDEREHAESTVGQNESLQR